MPERAHSISWLRRTTRAGSGSIRSASVAFAVAVRVLVGLVAAMLLAAEPRGAGYTARHSSVSPGLQWRAGNSVTTMSP